jgi:dihydroorotate dehydrogenase (fumarate)
MPDLATSYLGIVLKNPIIIASSGLTDSVEKIKELEKNGAAAVVLKSLFEEEIVMEMTETRLKMTGQPYVFPETMDYMDESGEEDTVRKYLTLIREAKENTHIPIIASINCMSSQKWLYLAAEIEKAGADALELNIFLLPSDTEREPLDNLIITESIIKQVKEFVAMPLSVKISYYNSSLTNYIERVAESGSDGIVLFNRSWTPDIDLENLTISSGEVLSSSKDIGIPLRWVSIMSGRIDCDIAASTGIHDGNGLIKMLLAGANAVQIASTIYLNGPAHIKMMLNRLEEWMKTNEFDKISSFKGHLSQSNSKNPAPWERVQFMKTFRQFTM